jgi:UDP-2,3-diacylglucosamine pyrophosphatase LpxH
MAHSIEHVTAAQFSENNLQRLYQRVPVRRLTDEDRIVIFSDLHMGNGGRTDDFVHNAEMFQEVLERYYADHAYHLILNGDVEDLQRFPMRAIVRRWPGLYRALAQIVAAGGLTRIVGNHYLDLLDGGPAASGFAMHGHEEWPETYAEPIHEGLRLEYRSGELFIFHGHQTSRRYENHNNLIRWVLRYLANPLQIGNYTVAADSRKRFKTERRVYDFASQRKILAVIGHTHRPLFESMSKNDSIQFEIERLCRKYPKSKKKEKIERRIEGLKVELQDLKAERENDGDSASLYQEQLLVPSMFNSGCVLGKRGMTSLEIERGRIRLIYWYDTSVKQKRIQYRSRPEEVLPGTRFARPCYAGACIRSWRTNRNF